MPLQQTSGNLTTDAYGGGAATKVKYIEDFFVTWLRTGTGASATVPTGLDASANKALVWTKSRSAATDHKLTDTVRGATKALISDTTGAQTTDSTGLTAFSSTGYTIGADTNYNNSGATYVDWEFVATPKFFDVVTYTGNGANRTIAHALGSTPGCIMVKRTDTTGDWQVYHNSLTSAGNSIQLNLTNAQASAPTVWNSAVPTSTVFSVGTDATVNASGGTYVAYVLAHNAGGFGTSGTDNVISCGSYTGIAGPLSVNLGYEPQWVLIKCTSVAGTDWVLQDSMRGMSLTSDQYFQVNTSNAENSISFGLIYPTATGFTISDTGYGNWNVNGRTYIYIAIRRGPMKVPTDGTKVFNPSITGGGIATITTGFASDSVFFTDNQRSNGSGNPNSQSNPVIDKLRGSKTTLKTDTGNGEQNWSYGVTYNNTGFVENLENSWGVTSGINNCTYWAFQRAPGFYDKVCYTGTGSNSSVTHNLQSVPQLIFVKERSATNSWWVYDVTDGNTKYMLLNSSGTPTIDSTAWNNTSPTASVFTVGTAANVNASGQTYDAKLFATLAGVSKVGTYTGTNATQAISCGFAGGARFVLIKQTNAFGDWYCFDSANGMTSTSSPYLLWSSGAAQTGGNNGCYASAGGFTLTSNAGATVNINGATYIFLAIA